MLGLHPISIQLQCCTSDSLHSSVWVTIQEGWSKPFDLNIRVWNLLFLPEIFVFALSVHVCLCVCVGGGMTERQVERHSSRETAFWGHCEPREKANDLSGPRCTVSLRWSEPWPDTPTSQHARQMWVNWHLFLAAAWAQLSSARPNPAAIFILITTPIITRDYSKISEHTHTHTQWLLWLRYSAPYGFSEGFGGDLYVFSPSVKSLEKASLKRTKESPCINNIGK